MQSLKRKKSFISFLFLAVIIFFITSFVSLSILLIYIFRFSIKELFNNTFPPKAISSLDLTQEQKIEDFEFLYDTVVSSMTSLDNYEKAYGFNFKDRKELYENLILETKNDYEFYVTLEAIFQDIPSFHTDLIYPTSKPDNLRCYNERRISTDRNVISYNQYWEKLVDKSNLDDDSKYYSFLYQDGNYNFSTYDSFDNNTFEKYSLEMINGIPVDEYVTAQPSIFNLFYDGKFDKPCREKIVFNDHIGTECKLTLTSDTGETKECTLFSDIYNDWVFREKISSLDSSANDFYSFDGSDVSYIMIGNMEYEKKSSIEEMLKNIKNDNVILDLRRNHGGYPFMGQEAIYPYLFSDSFTEKRVFYCPKSKSNKQIKTTLIDYFMLPFFKDAVDAPFDLDVDLYQAIETTTYTGKAESNKNVVILTSHITGSAADMFVHDMRKHSLAYVIGNNTGGEGLGKSFVASKLPNSNLVFIYFPWGNYTFENYDNSAFGTRPDSYSDSFQSFMHYESINTPEGFDDLYNNDETIRLAYNYLTKK